MPQPLPGGWGPPRLGLMVPLPSDPPPAASKPGALGPWRSVHRELQLASEAWRAASLCQSLRRPGQQIHSFIISEAHPPPPRVLVPSS